MWPMLLLGKVPNVAMVCVVSYRFACDNTKQIEVD